MIQNHAHQVIDKSVVRKLQSLQERKQEFVDESARRYPEDHKKSKAAPADTADRIIAATALPLGAAAVCEDEGLRGYKALPSIW